MRVPIRNNHLYRLCFADDQSVIAQDEDDFSYTARKLNDSYHQAGLEIPFQRIENSSTSLTTEKVNRIR